MRGRNSPALKERREKNPKIFQEKIKLKEREKKPNRARVQKSRPSAYTTEKEGKD